MKHSYQIKIQFFIITFLLILLCAPYSCVQQANDPSVTSHYTSLDDMQVHYILDGEGDLTLLFIHGWSCDTTFWKSQINYFKNNYRVIAIDLPGHGQSSKPKINYTFDLFSEAVKKVIDDAGVDKAFLVGHSMGYPVARNFIKKYPEKTLGLGIVDGAYIRFPSEPDKFAEWEKEYNSFIQAFKSDNRRKFLDEFIDSLFVKETPLELKEEIKDKVFRTPEHVGNSAMEEMIRPENWKDYSLSVPTFAVYAIAPDLPADNQTYLNSLFPSLEYHVWDNVGHFIMMEKPKMFNRLLSRYLKNHFNK